LDQVLKPCLVGCRFIAGYWSFFALQVLNGLFFPETLQMVMIDHPDVFALHAILDFHTFFDQGGGQSLGAKI
jgi:hypothetical protein